jgi:hypothetical protein
MDEFFGWTLLLGDLNSTDKFGIFNELYNTFLELTVLTSNV